MSLSTRFRSGVQKGLDSPELFRHGPPIVSLTQSGTCTLIFIRLCFALRCANSWLAMNARHSAAGPAPESAAERLRCKFVADQMLIEKPETGTTIMHDFVSQGGKLDKQNATKG